MQQDRRAFLEEAGKYIVLTGAAVDRVGSRPGGHAGAGAQLRGHRSLVGHDHRHRQVHRLRQLRARLQGRERRAQRAGLLPHVGRALPASTPDDMEHPIVDSPNGGYDGFPALDAPGDGAKVFFVPKMCNHCADSPCMQVCPVGATFDSPDGVVLVDKSRCLGCRYCVQACPYGCRYIDPRTNTADKCTLCYHRITKGLTTACCEVCPTGARQLVDLKNPKDPGARVPAHAQDPRAQAADGDRREGLLQRPRRRGSLGGQRSCRASKDSCTRTRSSSSGASSSCSIRTSPGSWRAPSSWRRSSACSTWRRCGPPTDSRCSRRSRSCIVAPLPLQTAPRPSRSGRSRCT